VRLCQPNDAHLQILASAPSASAIFHMGPLSGRAKRTGLLSITNHEPPQLLPWSPESRICQKLSISEAFQESEQICFFLVAQAEGANAVGL
jgi:hypothetical protein